MERAAVPFPVHRDDPLDPPAEYAGLLDGPPVRVVTPDGAEHWMVSRLADVRAVLADPRLSAVDTLPNSPGCCRCPWRRARCRSCGWTIRSTPGSAAR